MDTQLSTKASEATIKMTVKEYMTLWQAYTRSAWDAWLGEFTAHPTYKPNDDEIIVAGRRLTADFESHAQKPEGHLNVYEIIKCPGCGFDTLVDFAGYSTGANVPTKCAFCLDPELRGGGVVNMAVMNVITDRELSPVVNAITDIERRLVSIKKPMEGTTTQPQEAEIRRTR